MIRKACNDYNQATAVSNLNPTKKLKLILQKWLNLESDCNSNELNWNKYAECWIEADHFEVKSTR